MPWRYTDGLQFEARAARDAIQVLGMRGKLIGQLVLVLAMACAPALSVAQLMNEAEPLPGITTSGQPEAEQLAALAEKGFVAVIDLRGEGEDRGFDEAAAVEALGMRYVSLPVEGAEGVSYENAAALDALLREADGPVLVHCSSGNRAGALLSLRQRLIGQDAESALATGIEAGLTREALREAVESKLAEY